MALNLLNITKKVGREVKIAASTLHAMSERGQELRTSNMHYAKMTIILLNINFIYKIHRC